MADDKHEHAKPDPGKAQQPPMPPPAKREGDQPGPATEEDIQKIRRQTGAIAEVIEPVQRVRMERTDK